MSEENTKNISSLGNEQNHQDETEIVLENTILKKKIKKRVSKKTIVVLALIFTVVAIVAGKMLNDQNDVKLSASTGLIEQGTIEKRISANGVVSGTDSAEISSNLNYEFIAIHVKEGDSVKKGDILGTLDNKTLKSDYDMALKDVEIAKKQLEEQKSSAKLAVEERQIDYDEAKRQNDIAKQLFEEGGISNDELVQSNIMLEKALFALNSAKDALSRASDSGSAALGLQIKQEILATKKDNLDKANIKSPINGTVTRVNAKLGRIPTAQDQMKALFIVENLDDLIVNINISEYDISSVEVGQAVKITADVLGFGKSIEGKVSRIAPTGEVVAGAATKEMRIPVEISITSKDARMIAGVNAKADILIAQKENVLYVPLEAVLEENGENFLLLGNDHIIKKIKVQTGIESIANIEIISDEVKAGDKVILNPTAEFTDGAAFIDME